MGAKMIIPIPASYILANSRTESHKPKLLTILFHAIASRIITKHKRVQRILGHGRKKNMAEFPVFNQVAILSSLLLTILLGHVLFESASFATWRSFLA
jgi:hypothetical protein